MPQLVGQTIRFLTWNVRGLNNHRKVRNVPAYLKHHSVDIALLQETHLPTDSKMLSQRVFQGSFHASGFTTHARGVLTWVNPKSGFHIDPCVADVEGRYIVSRCKGKEIDVLVINVYGPNFGNPQFFQSLFTSPGVDPTLPLIVGGDFNCVLDPALDCSGGPERRTLASAKFIMDTTIRLDMVDVWRARYPGQGGYTHYSAPHTLHTRIGYWLLSRAMYSEVHDCRVHP